MLGDQMTDFTTVLGQRMVCKIPWWPCLLPGTRLFTLGQSPRWTYSSGLTGRPSARSCHGVWAGGKQGYGLQHPLSSCLETELTPQSD
jgi:hypothetical protein